MATEPDGHRPWYEIPEGLRTSIRFLGAIAGTVWEIAFDNHRNPAVLGFLGLILLSPEAVKAQRRRRQIRRDDEDRTPAERVFDRWDEWSP